jgi:hypothetical protein
MPRVRSSLLRMSGQVARGHSFGVEAEVYVQASQGRLILTHYATHLAKVLESLT